MNAPFPQKAAPRRHLGHPAGKCTAFSLLELLVVMAILAMLALMVTQMVGNTTTTIKQAETRIDADAQARLIFDRMASDFQGMARRPDINFVFNCQLGNDAFYFFSESTGHFADNDPYGTNTASRNTLSLVGYRVSDILSGGTRFELERLGRGLHWFDYAPVPTGNSTAPCYLPSTIASNFSNAIADYYNNSSNLRPSSTTSVPEWDVIGDQVVRMECCLLLKDGTLSSIPIEKPYATATLAPAANNDTIQGYSVGSRWYDQTAKVGYICKNATAGNAVWAPLGIQDISAVIVAIAILDGHSRIVANTNALANFSTVLTDFDPNNPSLMSITWQNKVIQTGFPKQIGLPAAAAAGVRIYQRYFYF